MKFSIKIVLPILVFSFIVPFISSAAIVSESFVPLVKKEMPAAENVSTRQIVKLRHQTPFGDPQMNNFPIRFFGGR
jgi:hypothetical protein